MGNAGLALSWASGELADPGQLIPELSGSTGSQAPAELGGWVSGDGGKKPGGANPWGERIS